MRKMEYKNELFILKQIVSLISMYVLLKIAPKKTNAFVCHEDSHCARFVSMT